MRSTLTEKFAKVWENVCAQCYMTTPEENQIDVNTKMESQKYFLKNMSWVNPVVMNCKIRHS